MVRHIYIHIYIYIYMSLGFKRLRLRTRHELHTNLLQLIWVNLNYKTACFGLWRPSSGLDPGTLKREKSWVASGVAVLQLRFTHIRCNKLVCNSCLVRNLNSYIYLLCSTFSTSYFNTLTKQMCFTFPCNKICFWC